MNETQQPKQPFKPQQSSRNTAGFRPQHPRPEQPAHRAPQHPTQKIQMPRPLSQMHKVAPAPRTVSIPTKPVTTSAPMQ